MNSISARQESRLARGLQLTGDEQRTLFEWRRDYDGRRGPALSAVSGLSAWQREMLLDQCRRLRDLLGDARFAVYLGRVSPDFDRMRTTLDGLGETNATAQLELWWLRRREVPALAARHGLTAQDRTDRMAQLRERAAGILGEPRLKAYLEEDDGRWLANNPRRRVVATPPRTTEPARVP